MGKELYQQIKLNPKEQFESLLSEYFIPFLIDTDKIILKLNNNYNFILQIHNNKFIPILLTNNSPNDMILTSLSTIPIGQELLWTYIEDFFKKKEIKFKNYGNQIIIDEINIIIEEDKIQFEFHLLK